jgi:hypothetical protein
MRKGYTPKKYRPAEPARNPNYPTKSKLALNLFEQFKKAHGAIRIRCIFADALYGTEEFVDQASALFGGIQIISQIHCDQVVRFRNKEISAQEYFTSYPGTKQKIQIRGSAPVEATVGSARLYVQAHRKKRFVIALKYEGEDEYRYIIASDLSWRTIDIVQAYTLRWLVEVFFQDRKANEGWGKLTKQPGQEGSNRSLILSLLVDHCLFFHPDQLARIENKLPACTVGSLTDKIKVEGILSLLEQIILSDSPLERFKQFSKEIEGNVVKLNPSKKHMVARHLGKLEPTPHLKYKKVA